MVLRLKLKLKLLTLSIASKTSLALALFRHWVTAVKLWLKHVMIRSWRLVHLTWYHVRAVYFHIRYPRFFVVKGYCVGRRGYFQAAFFESVDETRQFLIKSRNFAASDSPITRSYLFVSRAKSANRAAAVEFERRRYTPRIGRAHDLAPLYFVNTVPGRLYTVNNFQLPGELGDTSFIKTTDIWTTEREFMICGL